MAVETMCYLRCCLFGDSVEDSDPRLMIIMAAWRNGIASDYESGDCRFDPCGGHNIQRHVVFVPAFICKARTWLLQSRYIRVR